MNTKSDSVSMKTPIFHIFGALLARSKLVPAGLSQLNVQDPNNYYLLNSGLIPPSKRSKIGVGIASARRQLLSDSIENFKGGVALDMMTYYTGNQTGDIPGIPSPITFSAGDRRHVRGLDQLGLLYR